MSNIIFLFPVPFLCTDNPTRVTLDSSSSSLHVHCVVRIMISVTIINTMFTLTFLCKSVVVYCPLCLPTGWWVNYVLLWQGFPIVELKELCPIGSIVVFKHSVPSYSACRWELVILVAFSNCCVPKGRNLIRSMFK